MSTEVSSFGSTSTTSSSSTSNCGGILSHPLASKYRRSNSFSVTTPHTTSARRGSQSFYTLRHPMTSSFLMKPVYHGWLWKKGSNFKTWKKRFFLLQGATLTYYDQMCVISSEHYGTRLFDLPPKGGLRVVGAELSETTEFGIVVTSLSGRRLFVQAENQESRMQWLCALQQAARSSCSSSSSSSTKMTNESMILRETHGSDLSGSSGSLSPDLHSYQSTINSSSIVDSESSSSIRNRNSNSSSTNSTSMTCSHFDKSGWVQVRGMVFPAWKRKYLILQNGCLKILASSSSEKKKKEKVFYVIAVNTWNGHQNAFSIRLEEKKKEKELYVCVETPEEQRNWIEALRRCV
jgi:hypothetical protein